MENKFRDILKKSSDGIIANTIIGTFKEVEKSYFLKSWKTSELDAGHFVEAVRRFLEYKLFGKYTPIGKNLPVFNDTTMNNYLQAKGDDSYRIHLPRVLLAIYGIRNKRGVGHLSQISPSHLDATLILSSAKWILGELIRLNSTYPAEETSKMVDHIVERNIEGIWEEDDITRILVEGLILKEKIIFVLYSTEEKNDVRIKEIIEYSNKTYFTKALEELHKNRLIEYKNNGECIISPKGIIYAEKLILDKVNV
tara:strand:- start:57587 stop:58345 length:759 start_codon:yes stop_codon:yes gene_type:complete